MGSNAIEICAGASDLSMLAVFLSFMETPQFILWVGETLCGHLDDFKVLFGAKINLLGLTGATSGVMVVKTGAIIFFSCILWLGPFVESKYGYFSPV